MTQYVPIPVCPLPSNASLHTLFHTLPLNQLYIALHVSCPLGNGKTHYIKQKIQRGGRQALTIAVNESFNARTTIRQMRSLEMQHKSVIYFSFTLIPPSVCDCCLFIHLFVYCLLIVCCQLQVHVSKLYHVIFCTVYSVYNALKLCSVFFLLFIVELTHIVLCLLFLSAGINQ